MASTRFRFDAWHGDRAQWRADSRGPGLANHSKERGGLRLGRETGLPIPRFASLKSGNARMRIGPSTDYGTSFVYKVKGLPLEVIEEYENWRQVRDCDGVTGWMHSSLLTGRRAAMIGPWISEAVAIRPQPRAMAKISALLSPRVRLDIERCDGTWCAVRVAGHDVDGFVTQQALCGIYANETIR